jgi:hypothetical protein
LVHPEKEKKWSEKKQRVSKHFKARKHFLQETPTSSGPEDICIFLQLDEQGKRRGWRVVPNVLCQEGAGGMWHTFTTLPSEPLQFEFSSFPPKRRQYG